MLYFDLVDSYLSQAARKAVAMIPEGYQFQSKFGNQRFAEGKAEGKAEGQRAVLRKLLVRKFGELPAGVLARLEQASERELETWAERILDAASLDDVLRD